ncbi:hypothetical protein BKA81DRAFT_391829, partial [Phyllosticta paracitricarpa]
MDPHQSSSGYGAPPGYYDDEERYPRAQNQGGATMRLLTHGDDLEEFPAFAPPSHSSPHGPTGYPDMEPETAANDGINHAPATSHAEDAIADFLREVEESLSTTQAPQPAEPAEPKSAFKRGTDKIKKTVKLKTR